MSSCSWVGLGAGRSAKVEPCRKVLCECTAEQTGVDGTFVVVVSSLDRSAPSLKPLAVLAVSAGEHDERAAIKKRREEVNNMARFAWTSSSSSHLAR